MNDNEINVLSLDIAVCNTQIASINTRLKLMYLTDIRACKTVEELRAMQRKINVDLGITSSDEIPGVFTLEYHYQISAILEAEREAKK